MPSPAPALPASSASSRRQFDGIETGLRQRAHRRGARHHRVEARRARGAVARRVLQPHPRLGDDAEDSLRSDDQAIGARPGARARQPPRLHHAARRHHARRLDEVVDVGVERREVAARARDDPAAERRVLEALREVAERQAVRLELRFEVGAASAGLDARGAALAIDLEHLVQPLEVDGDRRRDSCRRPRARRRPRRSSRGRTGSPPRRPSPPSRGARPPAPRSRDTRRRPGGSGTWRWKTRTMSGYERPNACTRRSHGSVVVIERRLAGGVEARRAQRDVLDARHSGTAHLDAVSARVALAQRLLLLGVQTLADVSPAPVLPSRSAVGHRLAPFHCRAAFSLIVGGSDDPRARRGVRYDSCSPYPSCNSGA